MNDRLTVIDQLGEEVSFSGSSRIISLVPSQTEFLVDIGANLIGRTKFCIHPDDKVEQIPVVGGTKHFRFEKIRQLKPDLIIGNKEENYKEGIQELKKSFPVWMSDIYTIEDAFDMMSTLGSICHKSEDTSRIVSEIRSSLSKVKYKYSGRVLYLIWKNPWMAAGKNTFIDHMLDFLGFENVVNQARYPELTMDAMLSLNPDKILLSSEPYPFKEKDASEFHNDFSDLDCEVVDGELFSWYGSRLRNWGSQSPMPFRASNSSS